MFTWNINQEKLELSRARSSRVTLFVALGCMGTIGSIIILVAGFFLYTSLAAGNIGFESFFAVIFMAFALLAIVAVLSNLKVNHESNLVFDRKKQEICFFKKQNTHVWTIPWNTVNYIRLVKVYKKDTTHDSLDSDIHDSDIHNRGYNTYQIFLVLADGAHFWVDTFANQQSFQQSVAMLRDFMQLGIEDETGCDLDHKASGTPSFSDMPAYEGQPSPFVEMEKHDDGSIRFGLQSPKSLLAKVTYFLVFFVFFSIPSMIAISFLQSMLSGFGSFVIGILVVGFLLLFIALVVLFFIASQKTYSIRAHPDFLHVHMHFRWAWLNQKLAKDMRIPSTAIRQVRVNRLDQGHFWLSLSIDPDFDAGQLAKSLVFSLSSIRKDKVGEQAGEQVLGIWEVGALVADGEGCSYQDLRYIESQLQSILALGK